MSKIQHLLELEKLDNNLFRAPNHLENYRKTLYGGQVLGQALMACIHTVEDRLPNSLHAYFLRPGTNEKSVIYDVETVRDGRSFSSRRCVARQFGRPIFNISASFHAEEEGFNHQEACPTNIPPPEAIEISGANLKNRYEKFAMATESMPFDLKPISLEQNKQGEVESIYWMRVSPTPNIDKSTHFNYCALAFLSDFGLLATALAPHHPDVFDGQVFIASIDHAMWFHSHDFIASEWLLCKNTSPWAGNGRGFTRASIFNQQGELIANTTQEGLIRPFK